MATTRKWKLGVMRKYARYQALVEFDMRNLEFSTNVIILAV
jgi:hypothetical protein